MKWPKKKKTYPKILIQSHLLSKTINKIIFNPFLRIEIILNPEKLEVEKHLNN